MTIKGNFTLRFLHSNHKFPKPGRGSTRAQWGKTKGIWSLKTQWQVALSTALFLLLYGPPVCMLPYGDTFDLAYFIHKLLVLKRQ